MSCACCARPRGPPHGPSDATAASPSPHAPPHSAVGVAVAAAAAVRIEGTRRRRATPPAGHGGRVASDPSTRAVGAPTDDRALPTLYVPLPAATPPPLATTDARSQGRPP